MNDHGGTFSSELYSIMNNILSVKKELYGNVVFNVDNMC